MCCWWRPDRASRVGGRARRLPQPAPALGTRRRRRRPPRSCSAPAGRPAASPRAAAAAWGWPAPAGHIAKVSQCVCAVCGACVPLLIHGTTASQGQRAHSMQYPKLAHGGMRVGPGADATLHLLRQRGGQQAVGLQRVEVGGASDRHWAARCGPSAAAAPAAATGIRAQAGGEGAAELRRRPQVAARRRRQLRGLLPARLCRRGAAGRRLPAQRLRLQLLEHGLGQLPLALR